MVKVTLDYWDLVDSIDGTIRDGVAAWPGLPTHCPCGKKLPNDYYPLLCPECRVHSDRVRPILDNVLLLRSMLEGNPKIVKIVF